MDTNYVHLRIPDRPAWRSVYSKLGDPKPKTGLPSARVEHSMVKSGSNETDNDSKQSFSRSDRRTKSAKGEFQTRDRPFERGRSSLKETSPQTMDPVTVTQEEPVAYGSRKKPVVKRNLAQKRKEMRHFKSDHELSPRNTEDQQLTKTDSQGALNKNYTDPNAQTAMHKSSSTPFALQSLELQVPSRDNESVKEMKFPTKRGVYRGSLKHHSKQKHEDDSIQMRPLKDQMASLARHHRNTKSRVQRLNQPYRKSTENLVELVKNDEEDDTERTFRLDLSPDELRIGDTSPMELTSPEVEDVDWQSSMTELIEREVVECESQLEYISNVLNDISQGELGSTNKSESQAAESVIFDDVLSPLSADDEVFKIPGANNDLSNVSYEATCSESSDARASASFSETHDVTTDGDITLDEDNTTTCRSPKRTLKRRISVNKKKTVIRKTSKAKRKRSMRLKESRKQSPVNSDDEILFVFDGNGRNHQVPLDFLKIDSKFSLCWTCGKSFCSLYNLWQHKRTHKH